MPFKKDDKRINRNGRPVGAKNKTNADLRERINSFLNDKYDTIIKDFESLEPEKRIQYFIKLMEYSLPKLKTTDLNVNGGQKIEIPTLQIIDCDESEILNENEMTLKKFKEISKELDEMY